ncbi:MAG: GWxTD domain-containing protein [Phaeodactylibacter sp.]|nr:GWxTD domain-containing protein [Phaeodactylibacter sp.]MCB9299064.1 GWxTD domain-containing protein [Lewinellaceae bacterium]HQU57550.1 GWxTD domain-containing protein [Saprospiraceae bacterium]
MKTRKSILTIIALLGFSYALLAIDASVSYATFKSPNQNYVEVYLYVSGRSVTFQPVVDSSFQAQLEVIILFKKDGEIVKGDKYSLSSPVVGQAVDFIDLKRYGLQNGVYELAVAIKDLNQPDNAKEFQTEFKMDYSEEGVQQSSLQLLASFQRSADGNNAFVKNGLQIEPLPYNFYGRNASSLIFYNEVYNTDQAIDDDFLASYSIEKADGEGAKLVMIGHKRQQAQPIVPMLIQMDISKLPSGNYYLLVEIRNRAKELLSSKRLFFQRSNPFFEQESITLADVNIEEEFVQKLNGQQVEYSLRALTPKLPPADLELVNTMMRKRNLDGQRLYLFSYWARESPNNPEFAYQKYMEVASAIDEQFNSGFRHGFETDRGYIYLKYGQPDDTELRNTEPSAPPYEIWTYYEFPSTNQNNVKFIFYNPSLAPGDFQLLHSTATGELNNPQWQRDLYRDAPGEIQGSDYFEGTDMQDNFNRNANRVFRDY